jgi:hypothetical protein
MWQRPVLKCNFCVKIHGKKSVNRWELIHIYAYGFVVRGWIYIYAMGQKRYYPQRVKPTRYSIFTYLYIAVWSLFKNINITYDTHHIKGFSPWHRAWGGRKTRQSPGNLAARKKPWSWYLVILRRMTASMDQLISQSIWEFSHVSDKWSTQCLQG